MIAEWRNIHLSFTTFTLHWHLQKAPDVKWARLSASCINYLSINSTKNMNTLGTTSIVVEVTNQSNTFSKSMASVSGFGCITKFNKSVQNKVSEKLVWEVGKVLSKITENIEGKKNCSMLFFLTPWSVLCIALKMANIFGCYFGF